MKSAVYAGTFSPFTMGHLDILSRACALFDRVYVAVLANGEKAPVFTLEERRDMIAACARAEGLTNVVAETGAGLLVEYMKAKGACTVVRGLRGAADLAYESQLDCANRHLLPGFETVCLLAKPELSFLSSSVVREIGAYGGDLDGLVPAAIKNFIAERLITR
ncbi:MAG: pantetheine-phosphate adenylyltransferase [Christensenellaceae bacterium]|jgi:pantetheine-phosphate adenylyltransferase|nr:pantetheine-phosphate adenylyltransferase [Christensenellaceae bacterium]